MVISFTYQKQTLLYFKDITQENQFFLNHIMKPSSNFFNLTEMQK